MILTKFCNGKIAAIRFSANQINSDDPTTPPNTDTPTPDPTIPVDEEIEVSLDPVTPSPTYKDEQQVAEVYKPAVESMTISGILNGFEDGTFRPTQTLTREQGAKIITYLLLGVEKAETLTCSSSPYTDVKADRWSAASIAWCTDNHKRSRALL